MSMDKIKTFVSLNENNIVDAKHQLHNGKRKKANE
jgi:hypothetical protein